MRRSYTIIPFSTRQHCTVPRGQHREDWNNNSTICHLSCFKTAVAQAGRRSCRSQLQNDVPPRAAHTASTPVGKIRPTYPPTNYSTKYSDQLETGGICVNGAPQPCKRSAEECVVTDVCMSDSRAQGCALALSQQAGDYAHDGSFPPG